MSLFTKLVKKSVVDFLHKWKKWLIALTLFMGVLIGINLVLNHYVDKVVGSLIKEFVYEKSKGFYYVDFKEIAYILNSGRFYVSEFKFDIHPDHQVNLDFENLDQNYIYKAQIPSLQIDIIDFWSIFVNRKLRVIGIQITRPFIKIINLNKNKNPKKLSFEAGNLYEILSGQLNELKVNDFLISEGEFDYETYKGPDYDNFSIKELTFEVNNFQVNEEATSRKDKIFYTDDIFLEIKDQELFLKDSIHRVSFDKFYISTSSNEFGFENFNLTRRKNTDINVKNYDHYEINIPTLRLAGIDFLSAYNNNLLKIDSLNIEEPVVNIKKRVKKERQEVSRNSILDAAMVYHEFLMINHFNLVDAYIIFTDETKTLPKQYSVDHVSAHITNVEIDTGSYSKFQYGFNFDEADLLVKDYEVKLPDSVNTIKFDEFSISSNPFELKLKELNIQPNPQANSNSDKSLIYASVPYLVITEFDVAQAINTDTFLIEEVYIENPDIKVIQSKNEDKSQMKNAPEGLFGIYKNIQSISNYFKLDNLNLVNGNFELLVNGDGKLKLGLDKINVSLENLEVDSLTNTKNDVLGNLEVELSINNSFLDVPMGSARVQKLDFNSKPGRLLIDSLQMFSDTTTLRQNINVSLPRVLLSGIKPNEIFFSNEIILDSLKFQGVNIFADLFSDISEAASDDTGNDPASIPRIEIHHLVGTDYDVDIRERGFPLFYAININFHICDLVLDQSLSDNPLNQFDYNEVELISVDKYDLYLKNQNHVFRSEGILWNNNSSTFSMKEISLKPFGVANNKYFIEIPSIKMSGINLKKVLKESFYDGEDIIIDNPKIHLKLAQGKQEKLTSLDLGFMPILLRNRYLGAKACNFKINNAQITFRQQIENDSLLIEIEDLNLLVNNFEVDSTTEMIPDRFLFANDVRLEGDYLSCYIKEKSDFYSINHFNISTLEHDILLNGIYYATNTRDQFFKKAKTKLSIDNLSIHDFDFFDLTQNKTLDISEIYIDNAEVHHIPALNKQVDSLSTSNPISDQFRVLPEDENIVMIENDIRGQAPDSILLDNIRSALSAPFRGNETKAQTRSGGLNMYKKAYVFDTMMLKNIEIDQVLISDSKVTIDNSDEDKTGLKIPDIWFLAKGLKYNPIMAKDSSRIFYTDNLIAKITNFQYILPDNLTAIKVDELTLNSKDSTIKANNFAFIPMVSRYDYGPAKGFQSTWLNMENDSITMDKVDFLSLLNDNSFNASSLNVHKLDISIFRDKRVPFPEWQRRPLPQATLRGMNFSFEIDTVNLHNGFISYQEHSEKAYTTGEVFFTDLDATIINATNDSTRTLAYPRTRVGATTKIFGVGDIKAEFVFDLVDLENIHSYGVDVEPFDLTEFNRILIPSASVQISSGESKKIIMNAKANEDYSYGEMKFYYEDLKIQLLNRETETPKGLGNVLGSFFANTFIIKSNNPRNLFLRKGDIFFERDKKRAIFNYWTKTFLSGVVSSIGATNNKKKIKKMQEENLKKIQEEKKNLASN